MALTTQNANFVRQKAYNAVYGTGTGTSTNSVSPYHFYAVKALFIHLAMNKGNIDLGIAAYAAEDETTNGGYAPTNAAAACTLYAWFSKARRTSGTTAAFEQIFDSTDNNTSTATIATALINKTGQQFFFVWPNGMPIATGIVIANDTTATGATESTAANAADGFVIFSA
jgi:hypothetical protein